MATVTTGARLHFGFQNLALAHERLYGGVGMALDSPQVKVHAEPAEAVDCADPEVDRYASTVVDLLELPGASVTVEERFPSHVGLGSGTQLALATLQAIAVAYDEPVDPRGLAPELGRGGRSGVGVASFETGGLVLDAGHPTERFTTRPPERGQWTVPPAVARHETPADWRVVLVRPEDQSGPSGTPEDQTMRSVVERAEPGVADRIAGLITRRLLPGIATGDLDTFGEAVARLGRLNGAWYADEQGGVYRPPAGRLIEHLSSTEAIAGAGQSSWGPTVYGLTAEPTADAAREVGESALSALDLDGTVRVVRPRNTGAHIDS